jgi:uncharacterized membrane protein
MLWLYLALLSVVLFAITNIIDKYVLTEFIRKPLFNTVISGAVSFLGALVLLLFARIYIPSPDLLVVGLFTGLLFMLANYFFFRGVLSEEVSRAMPIVLAATPMLVLFIATFFLGEILLPGQYLGVVILLFSSILISIKKTARVTMSACFWLMVTSALFYAIQRTTMKYLLSYMDFWNVFFWMSTGAVLTSFVVMVFYHKTFFKTLRMFRKPALYASLSEALATAATFVFTVAMSFGLISLVQSVEYTQPAIVLAFATILSIYKPRIIREELKSSVLAVKIVAIGIMVVGMFLMA